MIAKLQGLKPLFQIVVDNGKTSYYIPNRRYGGRDYENISEKEMKKWRSRYWDLVVRGVNKQKK